MTASIHTLDRDQLLQDYCGVRAMSLALCATLEPEDMVVQSMPDVSPTKWHLAHVTWFFETIVLRPHLPGYTTFDRRYGALFNSYYQTIGQPHPRERRGLLSRPTVDQVRDYRRHVDDAMTALLTEHADSDIAEISAKVAIGIHHEQQHQELMLMDILHVLAQSPLQPAYRSNGAVDADNRPAGPLTWHAFAGGDVEIGADANSFSYDNERPRHPARLAPFELASRLVTAEEYRGFMLDGGYRRPELWLADGWDFAQGDELNAPLYWQRDGDAWHVMTLEGLRPLDPTEPVCHISFYEADAYARWAGCRLPTEFEWEHAATTAAPGQLEQLFGAVWQWTSSNYAAYPGYEPFGGSLGEYNGKFMINQLVLRGSCHATPTGHSRRSYRNFYHPHQRWMFAGLRLAR